MSAPKALAPVSVNPVLVKKDPGRIFQRAVRRLEKSYGRALVGASHWNQPDDVIDKLPPDMARAAYAARANKKEVCYGLTMAHEFLIVKARMDAIKSSKGTVNVNVAGNAVIQLPNRLPQPADADVVTMELDEVNED